LFFLRQVFQSFRAREVIRRRLSRLRQESPISLVLMSLPAGFLDGMVSFLSFPEKAPLKLP
jgi:hypothetical protein